MEEVDLNVQIQEHDQIILTSDSGYILHVNCKGSVREISHYNVFCVYINSIYDLIINKQVPKIALFRNKILSQPFQEWNCAK